MPDLARSRRRRRAGILLAVVSFAVEAVALRRRGYPLAGNVVVRCHRGHAFTTIWVPGASAKALRLGPWRVQRCPVGHHWSIVSPLPRTALTRWQRRRAAARKDIRIP